MKIEIILIALLMFTPVRSQEGCSAVPGCNCFLTSTSLLAFGKDMTYLEYYCNGSGLSVFPNLMTGDVGVIDLNRNKINDIRETTLAQFTEVLKINLHGNLIVILPEKTFYANVELMVLDLGRNQIRSLPEKIFSKNVNLEEIYLQENQIQSLSGKIFTSNVKLWRINLQGNQIENLPEEIFASNGNLNEINLNENQIKSLPENIFASNVYVYAIDLQGNPIESLPEKIFASVNNLWIFQISISFNCKCLTTGFFDFILALEVDRLRNKVDCLGSSDKIRGHRVVNCTDSSLITLYNSSMESQRCLCEEHISHGSSKENTVNSREQVIRYITFSTSMGVVAGLVTISVIAVNVLNRKFMQSNTEKILKLDKEDSEKQVEIWLQNWEIDFTDCGREMKAIIFTNTPPNCHLEIFSTNL